MKAIILAGGKGTRMAPYTTVLPKPLLPVGDMPILEIVIRQLKSHGIRDIILSVGYLGTLLQAYFGDGTRLGVNIEYSYEESPLGTAGPLLLVPTPNEAFLVMNGDLLTTIDFSNMITYHRSHGKPATIGLARKQVKVDLGVVELTPDKAIRSYIEKPTLTYLVSMGIYVFEPAALSFIEPNKRFDLPDLVLNMVRNRSEPMAYDSNCEWLDIGRPEDYETAVKAFEQNRALFLKQET